MKTLQKTLLAVSATALMATAANATISYGTSEDAQAYAGVKVASIDADNINGRLMGYGVYGGYNFDQNFGVEGEFVGSDKKEFTAKDRTVEGKVKTYGVYGTYRYNFNNLPVYAKAKLGVAKTDINVNAKSGSYTSSSDTTGIAGGVGFGFKPTANFGIEAGYNYLSSDANAISVGAHLAF